MYIGSSHSVLGIHSLVCLNCLDLADTTVQMPLSYARTRSSKLATFYRSLDQGMFPVTGSMVMYLIIRLISSSIGTLIFMCLKSFLLMTHRRTSVGLFIRVYWS